LLTGRIALGIVFLEIGLWEKAETMGGNNFQTMKQNPPAISKELLRQGQRRLGHRCGDKFREIVTRCLEGNFEVDQETDDKLGSELQSRFRERVVQLLEQLAKAV
jgi:hypothetical protein